MFTVLIIRPDLEIELGSMLALISAVTHAIAGLLVKKLSHDENILTLMFSMVVLMAPITSSLQFMFGKKLTLCLFFLYYFL